MKKLKLSIDGLKDQLDVMSAKELNSIAGGTYGGSYDDWNTTSGFVNNINGMISAGMFNYNGTQDFYGEYDASTFSGIDSSGSNPPGNSYNFFGSNQNNSFYLGSGRFNGSGKYLPGSVFGNFGSGWGISLTAPFSNPFPNATPSINFTDPNGRQFTFTWDPSAQKYTVKFTFSF